MSARRVGATYENKGTDPKPIGMGEPSATDRELLRRDGFTQASPHTLKAEAVPGVGGSPSPGAVLLSQHYHYLVFEKWSELLARLAE